MFFRQMTDTFLVRTEPASSIVKPAHIHITSAPQKRNENVFRTNRISLSIAVGGSRTTVLPVLPAARARSVRRLIFPELVSGNSSTNSTTRGYL